MIAKLFLSQPYENVVLPLQLLTSLMGKASPYVA
jgi:hypothetical protein